MRTIVHLSDMHFGRVDETLLLPLRETLLALEPSVVVISGDLTQRARASQFREAREYLDTLPKPQIVVPGNHDVPLYNVFMRFLAPLKNYRRYISEDLEPTLIDEEIAIVGINTARSLTFKGGRINESQVERIRGKLCALDDRITKIVVTHHPFDQPPEWDKDHIVGRAPMAMQVLSRCGADILMAGHAHMSHAGQTTERYTIEGFDALVVQAGTATSTRARGEPNSFNVLRVDGDEVGVELHRWNAVTHRFDVFRNELFEFSPGGWVRTPAPA